jgi:hypothetical protein
LTEANTNVRLGTMNRGDLYTSKEGAEKLRITDSTFRWRVWAMQLTPADRIGRYPLYSKSQLEEIRDYAKPKSE